MALVKEIDISFYYRQQFVAMIVWPIKEEKLYGMGVKRASEQVSKQTDKQVNSSERWKGVHKWGSCEL